MSDARPFMPFAVESFTVEAFPHAMPGEPVVRVEVRGKCLRTSPEQVRRGVHVKQVRVFRLLNEDEATLYFRRASYKAHVYRELIFELGEYCQELS